MAGSLVLSPFLHFTSPAPRPDPISRSFALLAEDKGVCCLLLLVGIALWWMPCGSLPWGWGMVRSWFKAFQRSWGLMMGKPGIWPCQYRWHTQAQCRGWFYNISLKVVMIPWTTKNLVKRLKKQSVVCFGCGEALTVSHQDHSDKQTQRSMSSAYQIRLWIES